jgi:hypothetical protein
MYVLPEWWPLLLTGLSALITFLAIQKGRHHFYSDTPWLAPLGIFVWGDALILGPFWLVSSLLFFEFSLLMIWRYFLIFVCFRSAYEVIYWINHQVVKKEYCPPLFRRVSWLGSQEAAILYQLMNMCQVVIAVSLLLMSFSST